MLRFRFLLILIFTVLLSSGSFAASYSEQYRDCERWLAPHSHIPYKKMSLGLLRKTLEMDDGAFFSFVARLPPQVLRSDLKIFKLFSEELAQFPHQAGLFDSRSSSWMRGFGTTLEFRSVTLRALPALIRMARSRHVRALMLPQRMFGDLETVERPLEPYFLPDFESVKPKNLSWFIRASKLERVAEKLSPELWERFLQRKNRESAEIGAVLEMSKPKGEKSTEVFMEQNDLLDLLADPRVNSARLLETGLFR